MQVEASDLVGLGDITRRVNVSGPSVVANWRTRYPGFPEPVANVSGNPLYLWPEVEAWLDERFDRVISYRPKVVEE
jgi:hypothetical protein